MDCKDLRELADKLQKAALNDDVWYDAAAYGDTEAEKLIADAQGAMESAVDFLRRIAELIE